MNLGRTETAVLTNKSGGAVAFGDVVVLDPTNALSFNTTTTVGYQNTRIGVVMEPGGIANNAAGVIAFSGYVPQVNLSGSAALLDMIRTTSVAKQAVNHVAPALVGDFGQVLNTGTTPPAMLWGLPQQISGGNTYFAPNGLTGATAASRYVGGTAGGPPTTGTFAVGDFIIDQTGLVWVCTIAGSPGTWHSIPFAQTLTSNFTTASLTAVATNLQYPAVANEVLDIDIFGTASKATTNTGLQLAINAPTGATIAGFAELGGATLAASLTPSLITAINTLGTTFATGIGIQVAFRVHVRVIVSTTPGNVGLSAATVTSNTATIYAGTKMAVRGTVQV